MGRIGTVSWSFQTWQKEKGFIELVLLGQSQHGTVETDKDRNLYQGRKTAGQGVNIIHLVKLGNLLVHNVWIGRVLGLELLQLRLQTLL
jgi:hypothetical protein